MDDEQKEFQAALLRSVEDMKAGRSARKTVFEVYGDEVRRALPGSSIEHTKEKIIEE